MRALGVEHVALDARGLAVAAVVTLARGWIALRGIGGIDTSLTLAIAGAAAISDLQCGYVFDRVLLTGGAALIAVEAARGGFVEASLGGAGAAAALAVPWALSRGRGMGFADVKLAGVLGCGLGLYGGMRALWFGFVIGAIAAAISIALRRHSRGGAIPFAPFLALGAMISAGSVP
jgi:leader peptidase (prepilin peptidase)/N-methyltransferase